jgi:sugar lactone lactonase YvrE
MNLYHTTPLVTKDQIISGVKTFSDDIIANGSLEVLGAELSAPNILFQDSVSYFQPSNDVRNWYLKGSSITLGESNPGGIFFAPDGLTVFILGTTLDTVLAYPLSVAWDATTTSNIASATLSITTQETNPQDLHFSPDGIYLFIVGTTADRIFRYSMTTPWDISTASYSGIEASLSVAAQDSVPTGLTMSQDGLNVYIVGITNDKVYQYALATAWDLSSASLLTEFSVALQETGPNALCFNSAGTRLYILGTTGDDITECRLTVPYDISTASFFSESFTFTFEGTPTGLFIHEASGNAYMIGAGQDRVNQIGIDKQLKYFGDSFTMDSQLYVGNRAEFRDQVYVNGALTSLGTSSIAGVILNGGAISVTNGATLGSSTNTVTVSIANGVMSTNTKTVNIGTLGRFTSTANLFFGSMEAAGSSLFQQNVLFRKAITSNTAITVKNLVDPFVSTNAATGAIAVFDTFTEVSDLLLQNHTPDIGTGWSREQVDSATASFTINAATNQLKPTANANNAGVIYVENTALLHPDYEVSMDLAIQDSADDNIWLIARYQDANNFYGVKWSTTASNCGLYKRVGGVFTLLGAIPNILPDVASSNLVLRVIGDCITVANGNVVKIGAIDSSITLAGQAGLAGGNIGQLATDDFDVTWRLDNFKVQYYEYATSLFENGDVAINNGGLILKSPNGTSYKITVNNDGSLQTTVI